MRKFYCGLCSVILLAACSSNNPPQQTVIANENQNSAQVVSKPTPATPLEKELDYIGGSNFRQVLVFSRKDGAKLTDEDRDYFRQYAPSEQINQRLKTEDSKHIVAGTNYPFTPEQLEALQKRFVVEDFTAKYGRK